jgi:hypothetical protein
MRDEPPRAAHLSSRALAGALDVAGDEVLEHLLMA